MPDLVIGGRRSAFPRPWRAAGIALGLLGIVLVVAWFIYRRSVAYDVPAGEVHGEVVGSQTGPGAPPALTYNESSLEWLGGIAVLRSQGESHAMGAAHGRLLAPFIAPVIRAARPSIEATVSDEGWFGGLTHNMRLAWLWRFVDDGLSDSDRRVIAGITRGANASGAGVGFDDVLRSQAVLDVGAPARRSGEAERHSLAHSLTVLGQQAQTPARVWIGRTFALPGLDDGGDSAIPVVQIAKPTGKLAWASVGWPGQAGVVTGINAQGIAVMVDPARTGDVRPTRSARPISLLARAILEQAKTLDEAVKMVEQTPTLGAALIVIVDGSSGKWVIVERTPSKAIVERNPKSAAFGDVLTTNALASDPENDRARRVLPTNQRVERAARLVRSPLADVTALAAVLRDQRGTDDVPKPAGHRGVIDDGRARHVVILDPASLEMWVADPSAAGRMRSFDLRHELRGEGDRPVPPADIAPDPAAEPDRVANLTAARAELRTAREALAHRDYRRASEACARARARAADLPEAIELDAAIAQARGDDARARKLFQLWLDGGADDPVGEERARALLNR
ncbi:MAG TPA: C45 family peptidase [Kofleriaceae bacterium]